MKKFVCSVCGYVYEGEAAPAECPICHAPAEKFKEQAGEKTWAAEHVVGVAQGAPEDIMADLRANFEGECSEVGMYLAMARVAHREGYPEIEKKWQSWKADGRQSRIILSSNGITATHIWRFSSRLDVHTRFVYIWHLLVIRLSVIRCTD